MTKEASEIGVCINSIAKSFFLMNSVSLKKKHPQNITKLLYLAKLCFPLLLHILDLFLPRF